MKYEVCAATDVGCKRSNNEDGFYINNMGCFYASETFVYTKLVAPIMAFVTDGVGGTSAGEESTKLCIQSAINENIPHNDNEMILLIEKINNKILELRKSIDSACTIAGVVLGEESSFLYNIGDSRVYSIEQGFLNQLSTDDTLSGLSGGFSETKEPLIQYLGKENILPHIKAINNLSTYLICTDGLTDLLTLDEIEALFAEHTDIKTFAASLIAKAKENGGFDNITLIIIKAIKEEA